MNIAVIPARSGSKRITDKNIRNFYGKPIISYPIKMAIDSNLFDKVYVSTDSPRIAEIAIDFGAEIPFLRDAELATDEATTFDVMQSFASKISEEFMDLDKICCIYPTTPLLTHEHLLEGKTILESGGWDFVVSGMEQNPNLSRSFYMRSDGKISMVAPELEFTRTQDIQKIIMDAGQFYWGRSESWIHGKSIFSAATTFAVRPEGFYIDVDEESDWLKLEARFSQLALGK